MRDIRTPEEARIRDALVRSKIQTWDQATAGTLANFRCEYCGIDFLDATNPDNFYQWVGWDHLIPRSRGGPDDIDNLVCSCWVCNRIKQHWNPGDDERFKGRSKPPRDQLIEAAIDYIKKRKATKDRDVQVWRDIVGPRRS